MSARQALIFDVNEGMSVSEAAGRHGVTRSCAYKWVSRFREDGAAGLVDRSRRPEFSPARTSQRVIDELIELKVQYPSFGPAKLVPMLEGRHGHHLLAVSTAGEILKRRGLVQRRRKRRAWAGPIERGPYEVAGAGDSMTADFKGQFRTADGRLCYPLTVADPFSRYVLAIEALPSTHLQPARKVFERVFCEYGVPRQIITDNGTPFVGARSLGGLTQLSRWWIEHGITPIRIEPGRPQQNGRHERMHRTLKAWIKRQRQQNLRAQQRSFEAFRSEFNEVRPHQALGQKTPASAFRSYRPFTAKPTAIEYDTTMTVRSIRSNGFMKWDADQVFVSEALIGAKVGLLPIDEGIYAIYFRHVRLGYFDALAQRVTNSRPTPTP